jgi:hypothetical protein
MNTLKTSFHRTFPLQRAPLAEYIRALAEVGRSLSFEEIREKTSLGTVKVESIRRYARASGLTNAKDQLTELGEQVVQNDSYLSTVASIWILHLGMIKANTLAPIFWNEAWKSLNLGDKTDRAKIAELILTLNDSDQVNMKTAEEAGSVFLTTYSKDDCLGSLGVIEKISKGYIVEQVKISPPLGVFAWFIAEQWDALFPNQVSVELNYFKECSGLSKAFKISPREVDLILDQMADNNLCDLYLSAPPYQIVRKWQSHLDILEKVYDQY